MAVERPIKNPIPHEAKRKPEATPLVSPVTAASSVPVAERMLEGKPLDQKEVSEMISNVANDLRVQGIPISSEDIRAVQAQAEKGLLISASSSKAASEHGKPVESAPLPEINLNEYKTVVENFIRNYGVDQAAWGNISRILGLTTLTGDFLGGMQRQLFATEEGRIKVWKSFQAIETGLQVKDKTPGEFVGNLKNLSKDRYARVGKLFLNSSWPFLAGFAHRFIERRAGKIAGKMFMTERTNLQEQVNNRVADSLFMHNFQFLDQTPSAEMLEIINRGKDATLDLMSAVYEELIPLNYAMWGSVGKQLLINKWDFGAALAKKLILETRVKPNAKRIQWQNDEALKRWDAVNTKLLTTLQGLETIRTTGNAEAGSDVLYQALAERDFVEAGGMREKRRQDAAMNKLFDVMDYGIPVATEGYKIVRQIASGINTKTGKPYQAKDMLSNISDAAFRVSGSQAEQQDLRQMAFQKTHLYVNRIIPDIQDIKRMDEVLGPYDLLDHPQGLRERARIPVSELTRFDIKVEHLKFKNILHNVSLDIPQGSFVTIKGPSGIGKSTLFRHLVGLYRGEPGAVKYGGVDIDGVKKYGDESIFTKIAYANQNPQYFEDMTLRDNLLLWTNKKIPNERIESVLKDLKLDAIIDRLDSKTKHFSGGEMRRIGIARALLKDPKVLYLDEPTANLDAASTLQVMKIIQELRKTRPDMTVVAITHDPVFEKIAEKVIDFAEINKPPESATLGDHQVLEAIAKP